MSTRGSFVAAWWRLAAAVGTARLSGTSGTSRTRTGRKRRTGRAGPPGAGERAPAPAARPGPTRPSVVKIHRSTGTQRAIHRRTGGSTGPASPPGRRRARDTRRITPPVESCERLRRGSVACRRTEPQLARSHRRLGPRARAEFRQHVADVELHGVDGDAELRGNLHVAPAACQ